MTANTRFRFLMVLLSIFLGAGVAQAQTAPYTDWVHDLGVAQKAQDAKAITALVEKKPGLSQVWFYGYVYDLVTPGVSAQEQTSIRFVSNIIAQTVATKGPSFRGPQRVMEQLSGENVAAYVDAIRSQEEKWEYAADAGGLLSPSLLVVNEPKKAGEVFYRALFKAEKWRTKLGGRDKAAKFLTIARRIAMGFALAQDDLSYWRTMTVYLGQKVVSLERLAFVEETIGRSLNVALSGSKAEVLSAIRGARDSVSKTRRDSLLAGLMMNALSSATERNGDVARAITVREQLFAGIRSLNMAALNEVVQGQLLGLYMRADKRERARRLLEELSKNQRPSDIRPRTIEVLLAAAAFFESASAKEVTAGRVARGIEYANVAIELNVLLAQDVYLNAYELAADAPAKRIFHTEAEARLASRVGAMHFGRAEYAKADAALSKSQTLYETKLNNIEKARGVLLTRFQLRLEQGQFDALRTDLRTMRKLSDLAPAQRASTHALDATVAFLLGEYAPAFAHANKGLTILHSAQVEAPNVAGALHAVAALTLEAADFAQPAIERWDWAAKFGVAFQSARIQSRLLMKKGETEKALAKLEPFFETDFARETTIIQGCLLAGTDRSDEAKASLGVMTPQLSLPQYRRYQAAGFACLAQVESGQGKHAEALRLANLSIRALRTFPSKSVFWKASLIKARSLSAQGAAAASSDAYEVALDALESIQFGEVRHGASFFDFDAGPLLSIERINYEAAVAAVDAAQEKSSRQLGFLQRAIQRLRLDRAQRAGSAPYTYQDVFADVDATRTLRTARTREVYLAAKVENPLLSERRRADLLREVNALAGEVERLTNARILAAKRLARPYRARLNARPEQRVSAYYLVSATGGHLILDRGSESGGIAYYRLPNAKRLRAVDEQIRALVTVEPQAWRPTKRRATIDPNYGTWKRLNDHARLLLPFMFDENRSLVEGKTIELFLPAQLLRTPFDALVIDKPSKRQQVKALKGPSFFSMIASPIYLVGEGSSTKSIEGAGQLVYGRSPLRGCATPEQKDCASSDVIRAVKALVEGTDTRRKHQASQVVKPMTNKRALVLGIPLNVSNAQVQDGDAFFGISNQANGVDEVVSLISHWDQDTDKNEHGLLRFWGGLTRNGTQGLALHNGSFGAESASSIASLSTVLSSGGSVIEGVRSWMQKRAASQVDPVEGGTPYHHPYYWAHWQIIGDSGQWKPTPLEPPVTEASPANTTEPEPDVEAMVPGSEAKKALESDKSVQQQEKSDAKKPTGTTLEDPFAEPSTDGEKPEASKE